MAWRCLVRLGDQGFGELRIGKSRLALWYGCAGYGKVLPGRVLRGTAGSGKALHGLLCGLVVYGMVRQDTAGLARARRGMVW